MQSLYFCPFKSLLITLHSHCCPISPCNPCSAFSHNSFFFFLEFYVSEMKQYIVFCVWCVGLGMILLRFINFIENIFSYIFIYLRAVLVEWMHNNLFICSLGGRHLWYFHFWALKNAAVSNIHFWVFVWMYVFSFGGKNLGVIISGNLDSCLTL